jgi:inorganic pyrophosphatase
MRDDKGGDDKIVAVSTHDPWFRDYTDQAQLPAHVMKEIRRFFEDYKTLENKAVVIDELLGAKEAVAIIRESLDLYRRLRRGELQRK